MYVRLPLALALLAAVGLNATLAGAQSAYPAIPKPSERRTGELEGWTDSGAKPAKPAPGKKGGTVAAAKAKPAEKPAREPDDGGLPLPRSQTEDNRAPVGFDAKGNMGTSLRF